jgi:hypothetical protein
MQFTKSLLNKLPRELLIEIIEKQNLLEYFTHANDCKALEKACAIKYEKIVSEHLDKIRSKCPKKFKHNYDEYVYKTSFLDSENAIRIEYIGNENISIQFICNGPEYNINIYVYFHGYSCIKMTHNFLKKENFPVFKDLYDYIHQIKKSLFVVREK